MPTNDGFQGVANCYVFKSQLQEYAQKVGIPTPVYETTKEGPSHEPSFKSTVIVNDVRYDSLLGFTNRKLAEQSAAEVALVELAKSGDVNQSLSQPIHETGLCKNLLQEYAQKMSYALPLYQCEREETPGKAPLFSCTVEIGGIRYVGAVAKTKKEAEIKVARTALLAIRSNKSESPMEPVGNTQLTVLPLKKRQTESSTKSEETTKVPKAKKAQFKKKKKLKTKLSGDMVDQTQVHNVGNFKVNMDSSELSGFRPKKEISGWVANAYVNPVAADAAPNAHDWIPHPIRTEYQKSAWERGLVPHVDASAKNGQSTSSSFNHSNYGTLDVGGFPIPYGNVPPFAKEVNTVAGAFPQANDVSINGQSTASYVSHGGNGSVEAGEFPLSYGTMAPIAKEVNLVSGAGVAVSVANNSGLPCSEASSVMAGPNLPENESKPAQHM